MLRGNNTIHLNERTMMDAIQHYFDTVLFAKGKAPAVSGIELSRDSIDKVFVIKCLEKGDEDE